MLKQFRQAPLSAKLGMATIVFYLVLMVFADLLAPYPEAAIVGRKFEPWGREFLLGTDNLGRDMLSRLIYAARNTVGFALIATLITFALGSVLGLLAAARGGWIDLLLSRLVDVVMSVPMIIFALLLLSIFGTGIVSVILVIAVLDSTQVYRLARAVAMDVTVTDFFEAAQLRGEGLWWQLRREILPNIMAPLIAEFGLRFCFVFLIFSALSFLGLGVQPPIADWGSMVRDNATLITFGDVTPLLPALAIAWLAVGVNFVVDWKLHQSSGLRS